MKYLTTLWQGIKNNSGTTIIVAGLLVYLFATILSMQTQLQYDKDVMACKTLCFPRTVEYITHGTSSSCWCYTSPNTMNRK